MQTSTSALAQVAPPPEAANEEGDAFVGFLIIVGVIWAICACNRKKTYDWTGSTRGTLRER